MRLWSIHPQHLDKKALVACWRESLLAYHVSRGLTKGYKNHPQLIRFRTSSHFIGMIELYLHTLCDEADIRGYNFDRTKIQNIVPPNFKKIPLTYGQLQYEVGHLREKILFRAPKEIFRLDGEILQNPIFELVDGAIEDWEKI